MKYYTEIDGTERVYRFHRTDHALEVESEDQTRSVDISATGDGRAFSMLVDGRSYDCVVEKDGEHTRVTIDGIPVRVLVQDELQWTAAQIAAARPQGPATIEAVMPGVVVEVLVADGDAVEAGQTLMVLEAMKMQNPIQAPAAARVGRVVVKKGDAVASGQLLIELEADGDG